MITRKGGSQNRSKEIRNDNGEDDERGDNETALVVKKARNLRGERGGVR